MQRWPFRRELEQLTSKNGDCLDACGVDHRLERERGRAPRGERIYEAGAGKRRARTRIIPAAPGGKLVAPFVFQGNGNTEVVDTWFEKVRLPGRPPGSVIVLDNARFHQSPTTAAPAAAAGCAGLLLPSYSPDLNPVEHVWASFKTRLRKNLPATANPFLGIANMSQCSC